MVVECGERSSDSIVCECIEGFAIKGIAEMLKARFAGKEIKT